MDIASRLTAGMATAWVALSLTACSSVHATYVPDGRRGYVVTCSGFLDGWSSCLVKAGRACGNRGYDTLKGGEDDRSIMVACKLPGTPATADSSVR